MKITDIIRAALDIIERQNEQPEVTISPEPVAEPEVDELIIIQQLSGMPTATEPDYANAPAEIVAPIKAAFPSGDDMHYSKNPADIRTNAPSMYPGYQAERR